MATFMKDSVLFPPALMATVPAPYSQEDVEDPLCVLKYFDAIGGATWWVVECKPGTHDCFGFVTLGDPDCAELGYFDLDEVKAACRMFERDLYWNATPLSEVVAGVRG